MMAKGRSPRIIETAGVVVVKPPSDAKVLFDGSTLDAWTSRKGEPTWEIKAELWWPRAPIS